MKAPKYILALVVLMLFCGCGDRLELEVVEVVKCSTGSVVVCNIAGLSTLNGSGFTINIVPIGGVPNDGNEIARGNGYTDFIHLSKLSDTSVAVKVGDGYTHYFLKKAYFRNGITATIVEVVNK